MNYYTTGVATAGPIPQMEISRNPKIRYQALKDYYENKLRYLEEGAEHPHLLRMACWDAPVMVGDLSKWLMRKLFKWQARQFYRRRLKETERRLQKIAS